MLTSSIDNDGRHVAAVLNRTDCDIHHAPEGIPCWHVTPGSSHRVGYLAAVCGSRVRRAGFVGAISAVSLQLNTAGGRSRRRS